MSDQLASFSDEQLRAAANLAQRYDAWADAVRQLDSLPSSMYYAARGEYEYLMVKRNSRDNGTSAGPRTAETDARLAEYQAQRSTIQETVASTERLLAENVAVFRSLKMPQAMPKPGRFLRELDLAGLLGNDVMAVGTNAFAVYQIEATARFLNVADETEDFDLAWCRDSRVSLAQRGEKRPKLMEVLRRIDKSFHINRRKPYQALDSEGYQVELLVAPSLFRTRPPGDDFSPMATFPEQEWLLQGRPVRHVIVARDGKPVPIFAPDPRWMALHKIWLSRKPDRNATKKKKDLQQGEILLHAVAERMQTSYPMDTNFVMDLPEELLPIFNEWASKNNFVPGSTAHPSIR
jgi:hypothetical protein